MLSLDLLYIKSATKTIETEEFILKLVIAEKPSVGQSIAAVLGVKERKDGYLIGNGYIVSW
jgi:DNA topoisomerase-3